MKCLFKSNKYRHKAIKDVSTNPTREDTSIGINEIMPVILVEKLFAI